MSGMKSTFDAAEDFDVIGVHEAGGDRSFAAQAVAERGIDLVASADELYRVFVNDRLVDGDRLYHANLRLHQVDVRKQRDVPGLEKFPHAVGAVRVLDLLHVRFLHAGGEVHALRTHEQPMAAVEPAHRTVPHRNHSAVAEIFERVEGRLVYELCVPAVGRVLELQLPICRIEGAGRCLQANAPRW